MRQIHRSAWLLVVLSAVLQVLIFPLPGLYVLSWIALTPLIIALLRTRPAGELEVAGLVRLRPATPVAGISARLCLRNPLVCGNVLLDLRHHAPLRRPERPEAVLALFLFCCYLGLYHGLFGLLVSLLARPGRTDRRALVIAPFLWVAVELARTRITGFPWNLLGHRASGQRRALPHRRLDRRLRNFVRDRAGECRVRGGISDPETEAWRDAGRGTGRRGRSAGRQVGRGSSGKGGSRRTAGPAEYSGLRRLDACVFPANAERIDRSDREVSCEQRRDQDRSDRLARVSGSVFHQRRTRSAMRSARSLAPPTRGSSPAPSEATLPLRIQTVRLSTPQPWSAQTANGPRATTKFIWCPSANTFRSPACFLSREA